MLGALASRDLAAARRRAREAFLVPKRHPDLEGRLLWEAARVISAAEPALACEDHVGAGRRTATSSSF